MKNKETLVFCMLIVFIAGMTLFSSCSSCTPKADAVVVQPTEVEVDKLDSEPTTVEEELKEVLPEAVEEVVPEEPTIEEVPVEEVAP